MIDDPARFRISPQSAIALACIIRMGAVHHDYDAVATYAKRITETGDTADVLTGVAQFLCSALSSSNTSTQLTALCDELLDGSIAGRTAIEDNTPNA